MMGSAPKGSVKAKFGRAAKYQYKSKFENIQKK